MANIPATSFSRLKNYEQCGYRAKLAYIDRIKEPPQGELPPGQEHPNDRGTRVHNEAERYVREGGTLIPELKDFENEFTMLRTLYQKNDVELEQMWLYDKEWGSLPDNDPFSKKIWLRIKCDAVIWRGNTEIVVIDYKGLPLDTPLPTPTGWTTMGAVQEGDTLLDSEGNICTVTGKSQIKKLPCYRITFDDTSEVICDEEHRWTTINGEVKAVTELVLGDMIRVAAALQLPDRELILDPYILGFWLADGKHTSGEASKPDNFIWEEIQRRGFNISHDYNATSERCRTHTIKGLRTKLNALGLLGNKHIPVNYLRASYAQRLDLLRGLMDGDGSVNHTRKQAVINTTQLHLAEQFKELLLSLGQRPLLSPYIADGFGKKVQAYAVSFRPQGINPFLLPRKADKVLPTWGVGTSWRRRVQKIELVPTVQTQCIMVDSPNHTFLCSTNFIPTHNTGKRSGKEVEHAEQCQLYQLGAFMRYPAVNKVTTELWYTDQNELVPMTFTRAQGLRYHEPWTQRLVKMTTDEELKPNPNIYSCRWCPYKTGQLRKGVQGTGDCDLNPE